MSGHVYKRCGCQVHRDAKGKKLLCPRTHGSWTFVANATMEGPQPRRQHTKGVHPANWFDDASEVSAVDGDVQVCL